MVKIVFDNIQQRILPLGEAGQISELQAGKAGELFGSDEPLGDKAKTLNIALAKLVNNNAEWQQIFREAWRFQRDYFYVTNLHGADWDTVYEAYQPDIGEGKVGLLGADLEITGNGYRLGRIYRGENWYPAEQEKAPLAKLAGQVREGDYLLAVNGKPLSQSSNFYEAMRGTVGKQTKPTQVNQ